MWVRWWRWEGGIMILKGMVWGEFEFMVEIMRVLGELIFLGRGWEYMNVKGSSYEFLSAKSMHILKCEIAWLILRGKYFCNIEKIWVPIKCFMLLSNVPIIKCDCKSYTPSKGFTIIILQKYRGRIRLLCCTSYTLDSSSLKCSILLWKKADRSSIDFLSAYFLHFIIILYSVKVRHINA